jgi:hypothetical protein
MIETAWPSTGLRLVFATERGGPFTPAAVNRLIFLEGQFPNGEHLTIITDRRAEGA